jgi:hypothetical protein
LSQISEFVRQHGLEAFMEKQKENILAQNVAGQLIERAVVSDMK